ncbi:hypothetical protein [Thalassobacillus sp. CUG 92003]|uniref:hypothetical protein n=1 Tax=Thalassobacillus sp. CUG 92003 TaxID=2736641 RepID=UPI0015E68C5B|nr:hypothetical protein [Thalassobacillus sp. CUG 92003]
MHYKLLARDKHETQIEFFKRGEELTFGSYEAAEHFAEAIKQEYDWTSDYTFSIVATEIKAHSVVTESLNGREQLEDKSPFRIN